MDEQKRQQRTSEAATPRPTYWEMLEQLTPKVTRPDPDGEEVIQTVGCPQASAVGREVTPPVEEPRSSTAKAMWP